MSHIATVMVWASVLDDVEDNPAVLAHLNGWLAEHGHGAMVELTDVRVGGKRAPQATWYAGAHNYLNIPRFLEAVWSAPWEDPEGVAVILEDEHDDAPTMYRHPRSVVAPRPHEDWEADEVVS